MFFLTLQPILEFIINSTYMINRINRFEKDKLGRCLHFRSKFTDKIKLVNTRVIWCAKINLSCGKPILFEIVALSWSVRKLTKRQDH